MSTPLRPYQQAVIDEMRKLPERVFVNPKTVSQIYDIAITGPSIADLNIGLLSQHVGRALRGRLVHAARARKLRRRGEIVRFAGYTSTGQIKYRWIKVPRLGPPPRIDFKHDPANAGQNEAQLAAYNWVLDDSHHQKLGG